MLWRIRGPSDTACRSFWIPSAYGSGIAPLRSVLWREKKRRKRRRGRARNANRSRAAKGRQRPPAATAACAAAAETENLSPSSFSLLRSRSGLRSAAKRSCIAARWPGRGDGRSSARAKRRHSTQSWFPLFFFFLLFPLRCGVAARSLRRPTSLVLLSLSLPLLLSLSLSYSLTSFLFSPQSSTPPNPHSSTDRRPQDWPVLDWKTATAISVACEFFFCFQKFPKAIFGIKAADFFFSSFRCCHAPPLRPLRPRPRHSFSLSPLQKKNHQTSAASSAASAS